MTRSRWLLPLIALGLVLDLFISGWLWQQNDTLRNVQHTQQHDVTAAACWDDVLVIALHDHLTPAQRQQLLAQAGRCAEITR